MRCMPASPKSLYRHNPHVGLGSSSIGWTHHKKALVSLLELEDLMEGELMTSHLEP